MEDKKKKVLLVITIIVLIVLVFGATYAYFVAQTGLGASANMNIQAGTTDSLMFEVGSNILIDANQKNFGKDKGNLVGSTSAKAVFKPGSTPNENPYKYNVFFIINDNDFIYTRDDNTPELIMRITKPNGEQIESIVGLNYTNDAFDITGKLGSFLLTKDYEITGTVETTQEWLVEVTLVNLDTDQQENTGKTFTGSIFITTENIDTYVPSKIENVEVISSYDSVTVTANVVEGTRQIDKYFFAIEEESSPLAMSEVSIKRLSNNIEDLTWYESNEPIYNFTNLKANTDYKVYSYGIDKNNIRTNVNESIIKTRELTLASICQGKNMASCIKENYTLDNTIYYHDVNLENGAGDNSYRYAGPSEEVNNFVCFGSDVETCPDENLYRIIGVFDDKVKLIKYDYATKEELGDNGDYGGIMEGQIAGYYYNYNGLSDKNINYKNGSNDWESSLLNIVNLNVNYLSKLNQYESLIMSVSWNIGGPASPNKTVKFFLEEELKQKTKSNSKIGLMYASDYGYAAYPNAWDKNLFNYNSELIRNNNWLFKGLSEWVITPNASSTMGYVFSVEFYSDRVGNINNGPSKSLYRIRPVFYLNSEILLKSGSGTKENPYRIN